MTWDRDKWGEAPPAYTGDDVLGDLHGGKGTMWTRTRNGYVPSCTCHGPKPPTDTAPHRSARPEAVIPARSTAETPAELDDETALRLLATWLRRLATRTPKGEK